MTILKATAAMLLLGGGFNAADQRVAADRHGVADRDRVAARSAQTAAAKPAPVTITLVRWPFT